MENFESYVESCKDIINYYERTYSYLGKDSQDDIKQECLMAIFKASTKYNSELGSFKTYATGWIKTHVYDYINALESPVSISRESNRKIRTIRNYIKDNPFCTIEEISLATGYSKDVVLTYYQGFYSKSLNDKLGDDDSDELSDTISDDSYVDRNELLIKDDLMRRISLILSEEEQELIYNAYGIGRLKVTQTELARRMGITHQAVSKKINNIIKRLQSEMKADCGLYLYLNTAEIVNLKKLKMINSFVAYDSL